MSKGVEIRAETICAQCCHYRNTFANPQSPEAGYNHVCEHSDTLLVRTQNPVTGTWGYANKDDLTKVIIVGCKFPRCDSLNFGNCPNFVVQ